MQIFHGTSQNRAKLILSENRLRPAPTGTRTVSFTTDRMVADYFAAMSASCDAYELDDPSETTGVVLVLESDLMVAAGFPLYPFEDDVWGVGACAWEKEFACPVAIHPLSAFLVRTESGSGRSDRPAGAR
jgi:hypothetical protein